MRSEGESERIIGELTQALKRQEDEAIQAKQASAHAAETLKQERDDTAKLGVELANARRAGEAQAVLLRSANDEATRIKEASARATDELRQALQQAQYKAEKLAVDLAAARTADAEVRRAAETSKQSAEEQGQALRDAQARADKLSTELATARQDVEVQKAAVQSAGDEAQRAAETSRRNADAQSAALREAEEKAEKLGTELAAAHQEIEAQKGAARAVDDEARRTTETGKRSADEQDQALREARARSAQLGAELAAAQREIQAQVAVAGSMRDQAADMKETAGRSADEQRRALQQERERTGKLAAELAEARSSLAALAQAKAAQDAARDRKLAAMSEELQKAQAEATRARDALGIALARSEPPAALPVADRPSIAPPPAPQPPTAESTGTERQATNASAQPAAAVGQGDPQAVRLIARANLLLEQGNIGAARNMLDRAAEMGSMEALFWLAETYDPRLLSARQTYGTQSDIAKAREFYRKALAGGVDEAKARLEALQQ